MKIAYSDCAAKQLDKIYTNSGIYDSHSHFTQQFLNWNREFHRYINPKEIRKKVLTPQGVYTIGTIGTLEYNYLTVTGAEVFEIIEFRFSELPYATSAPQYTITGDAGYGYKIIQSTFNGLYSILTPQSRQLTKFSFNRMIGFHHSYENYNIIHAIGFIGNRVYEILQDGTIKVLHISKQDYLDKKHRYDESMRRLHALLLTEASKQRRNGNRYWRRGARNNPKVGKWDVVKGSDYPGRWNGLEDFGDICDTCLYGTPGGNGYMAFRKGANSMKFFFAEVRNDNGKPRYTPIKPDAVPAEILCDRERWGYHPGRGFNPYAVV